MFPWVSQPSLAQCVDLSQCLSFGEIKAMSSVVTLHIDTCPEWTGSLLNQFKEGKNWLSSQSSANPSLFLVGSSCSWAQSGISHWKRILYITLTFSSIRVTQVSTDHRYQGHTGKEGTVEEMLCGPQPSLLKWSVLCYSSTESSNWILNPTSLTTKSMAIFALKFTRTPCCQSLREQAITLKFSFTKLIARHKIHSFYKQCWYKTTF